MNVIIKVKKNQVTQYDICNLKMYPNVGQRKKRNLHYLKKRIKLTACY